MKETKIEQIEINPNQFVWVDKEADIKEGEWYYDDARQIRKAIMGDGLYWAVRNGYLKIIAASPELNIEGVPTYVEWLANDYSMNEKDSKWGQIVRNAVKFGYQTAEKELPTWDDVRKAIEMAREGIIVTRISEWETEKEFDYSEEEIIEQLKQSKL